MLDNDMSETLHFVCEVELGLLCLAQPVRGLGKATDHSCCNLEHCAKGLLQIGKVAKKTKSLAQL